MLWRHEAKRNTARSLIIKGAQARNFAGQQNCASALGRCLTGKTQDAPQFNLLLLLSAFVKPEML